MRNVKNILLILTASCLLANCNTVSGFGKDMQRGGEKLENSAEKNKSKT
jgi:entericidin B